MSRARNPERRPRTRRARVAKYPTNCESCHLVIRVGEAIAPRPGGGYQHASCASGSDDE